jgi:hypothetical protein
MKKNLIIFAIAAFTLSSCGTYTGAGAANGAYFGSVLGSAIGGLSNGYHGSNVGTIIGMAGGAAVGAAIGSAADQQRYDDMNAYRAEKARLAANREARRSSSAPARQAVPDFNSNDYYGDDSGFDPQNSGDDRIDIDFGNDMPEEIHYKDLTSKEAKLEIRNVRFVDPSGNNTLTRGEQCDIVFEIFNAGEGVAYNVEPTVKELTGNKHILVSPSILVESLAGQKGVRYTARVVADRMLKDGTAKFSVSVLMNKEEVTEPIYITVKTAK